MAQTVFVYLLPFWRYFFFGSGVVIYWKVAPLVTLITTTPHSPSSDAWLWSYSIVVLRFGLIRSSLRATAILKWAAASAAASIKISALEDDSDWIKCRFLLIVDRYIGRRDSVSLLPLSIECACTLNGLYTTSVLCTYTTLGTWVR